MNHLIHQKHGLIVSLLFIVLAGWFSSVQATSYSWMLYEKNTIILRGTMKTNLENVSTEELSACSPSLPCLAWTGPACRDNAHHHFALQNIISNLAIDFTYNTGYQSQSIWHQLFPLTQQPVEHITRRRYSISTEVRSITSILSELLLSCFCSSCLLCDRHCGEETLFAQTIEDIDVAKEVASRNHDRNLPKGVISQPSRCNNTNLINASLEHRIYAQSCQPAPSSGSLLSNHHQLSPSNTIILNLLLQDSISQQPFKEKNDLQISTPMVIPELFNTPVDATLVLSHIAAIRNTNSTPTHYMKIVAGKFTLTYFLLRLNSGNLRVLRLIIETGGYTLTINIDGINPNENFSQPARHCYCGGACLGNCGGNNRTDDDRDPNSPSSGRDNLWQTSSSW